MTEINIEYFLKMLEKLSPEERDTIIGDCIGIVTELQCQPDEITKEISDLPKGMIATLEGYFYLYLWILHLIDEKFIQSVGVADPADYESVKTKFLTIIRDIPVEMIDPILKVYNQKIHAARAHMKKDASVDANPVVMSQGVTGQIIKEDFIVGLEKIILNVQNMIKTKLHEKIEDSFTEEKETFLKALSTHLALLEPSQEINDISEEITKIFRNWAETKEQLLDESGRKLMQFLTSPGNGPQPDAPSLPDVQEQVALPMARSFTCAYSATKTQILPSLLRIDLQELIKREQNHPERGKLLSDTQWQSIKPDVANSLMYNYLQGVIKRLEHANRFVFAIQQLAEVKLSNTKKLSATPGGASN